MSSICQIHICSARRLARWFLINLFVAATLCASDRTLPGPVALDLHRHNRGHQPPADPLARRRPREGTVQPARAGSRSPPARRHPIHRPGAHRRLAVWICAGRSATYRTAFGCSDLSACAISIALFFHAMMANRFFSAVIRIQKDRGHHVIDQGPYAVVRHPGYAGMVPSMAFNGLALGSWLGFAIGVGCSALMMRRVLFEDAYLRRRTWRAIRRTRPASVTG